jgi:hypothetical protein
MDASSQLSHQYPDSERLRVYSKNAFREAFQASRIGCQETAYVANDLPITFQKWLWICLNKCR